MKSDNRDTAALTWVIGLWVLFFLGEPDISTALIRLMNAAAFTMEQRP